MKVVLLNSKSSYQDILNYGPVLFDKFKKEFDVVSYDEIKPDFSNIPELFDDSEKLVMINHFAMADGFSALTKYLPKFKNIKYIVSPYSAYEGLDLELLKKMGIRYRNNGGANAKSVAQYAITTMFMLLGKFPVLTREMKMPDGSTLGEEYHGKTAGIIGMGNVGREILNTLSGLKIQTVYYNRTDANVEAKKVALSDIFKQDIVFISIATNDETMKLLSDLPEMLQPDNYLIDISVADELYDKQKVVQLLSKDSLKGYALEVFDAQAFSPKSGMNLIVTPHIAWCTVDAEKRTVEDYLNRAMMILRGEANKVDFIV